jgi:SAM-dependent methyltransferase
MPSLLLGAGHSKVKKVYAEGKPGWVEPLITLDMGTGSSPDVVWDLENRPLPFEDNTFDEMGAYDVLEHVGKTGDWRGFFDEFSEYHRILKPGGQFGIVVPIGPDAFADPGHTRFFSRTWFAFLDQDCIARNLAEGRNMTDYRWYWKKHFKNLFLIQTDDHHLSVMLEKA